MFEDRSDISEYFSNKGIHEYWRDHPIKNPNKIPMQEIMGKIAKNHYFPVINMHVDYANEKFVYEIAKTTTTSEMVEIPFTAISKEISWLKSWKYVDNGMSIEYEE